MSVSDTKTVCVAGATGFMGSRIVRELLERGHEVRALVRDPDKADAVFGKGSGVHHVVGDVLEKADELVQGCDACINAIGIIREAGGGQTFKRMHVLTTEALLSAAKNAGANRYLQISALGVSDQGRTKYEKTKWEAELAVRRSGLDWTIMRPSLVHGPSGEMVQLIAQWARKERLPRLFLPYFKRAEQDTTVPAGPVRYADPVVEPVSVDDVALAVANALEREEAIHEVYNLTGPERLTWPELLEYMRDQIPRADTSLKACGVPSWLAAGAAFTAGKLGMGPLLDFDEGMAIMGAKDSVADSAKARLQLGFDPAPFREKVRGYAPQL